MLPFTIDVVQIMIISRYFRPTGLLMLFVIIMIIACLFVCVCVCVFCLVYRFMIVSPTMTIFSLCISKVSYVSKNIYGKRVRKSIFNDS